MITHQHLLALTQKNINKPQLTDTNDLGAQQSLIEPKQCRRGGHYHITSAARNYIAMYIIRPMVLVGGSFCAPSLAAMPLY